MAWILSPEPQKKNLPVPPTIEEIVNSKELIETETEQESYLLEKMKVSEEHIKIAQAINWGVNNEAEATKSSVQATGLTVEDSGLWLDPSGILGASPDGLIVTNCLLEVKCPFTQRHSEMAEEVKSKDFHLEKNEGGYSLKKTHAYWPFQGQQFKVNCS
eukprot:Seg1410.11 transcript_id=Seg1410.11/GoldUCD/mRNA.D3Y31 product="hypothetical protein" protein_id=Seg1410.11/GoldUCD/D3Y31